MKKWAMFAAAAAWMCGAANAADIWLYYSPSCPHCHHARAFFAEQLIYEYPDIEITSVNVMDSANRPAFADALAKCNYNSGGVPVIVVGDTCFQGYADFMADDIRAAVASDMTANQQTAAAAVRDAMTRDADGFRTQYTGRVATMTEYGAAAQKKTTDGSMIFLYILMAALVVGLVGVMGTRRRK
ncbi:hypothetical protein HDR63_00220 [bacterium]|nr:hypothetical protein [bacterium]